DAGVAVDADRHVDVQGRVQPLGVPDAVGHPVGAVGGAADGPLHPRPRYHRSRRPRLTWRSRWRDTLSVPESTAAARPGTASPADPDRQLTSQGRERKQQLVDCAAQLFAERGFAETRIKDIVDAAGVAKGLFYWYFENKEALFAEVAADIRLRLRKHQATAIDRDAAPLRQIRQGAQARVHFMAAHAHFVSLLEP